MSDKSYTPQDLKRAFNKAKVGLMGEHNSVFITTVLFSLKSIWTEEIPTAGVDGVNLFMNPDFFMEKMDAKERIFLLAHEAWHVAFNHMTRGMHLDKEKYNKAADYVINLMLKNAGYAVPQRPDNSALLDEKYADMSAEQVYKKLEDSPDGGGSSVMDGDIRVPDTKEAAQEIESKVTDILVKAATQSKMQGDAAGTIPGDIEVMLEKLINPVLDWRTLLANYMSAYSKSDYSMRKPNKRFMPDFFLPTLYSENMDSLAVAFDSSGSVHDHEFAAYFSEVKYMREIMNPKKTTIMSFDTQVKAVHELTEDDSMDGLKFTGRGGTSLFPVFKHFEKQPPTVLIVFSDLYCQPVTEDPGYDVIWVCVNNPGGAVNFGKLIHHEIECPQ